MLKRKGFLTAFAAAAVLLCVPLSGSATAATRQSVAPATATTVYQIVNTRSGGCLQQDGTTDKLYVGACSTGHSALWLENGFGTPCLSLGGTPTGCAPYELVNYHSRMCVSETGSAASNLYMNGCATSGASAQEWYTYYNNIFDPNDALVWSAHSRLCMWQGNPGVSTVSQATCSENDSRDNWDLNEIVLSS
jgi:hypothetical protein